MKLHSTSKGGTILLDGTKVKAGSPIDIDKVGLAALKQHPILKHKLESGVLFVKEDAKVGDDEGEAAAAAKAKADAVAAEEKQKALDAAAAKEREEADAAAAKAKKEEEEAKAAAAKAADNKAK